MKCNIYLRLGHIPKFRVVVETQKIINIFKYIQNIKYNIYLRLEDIFNI